MPEPKRIIVELIPMGNYIKVSAICEDTGREVSMVGDPKVPQKQLEKLAINKLKYVMRREDEQRAENRKGLII